jgi:hypothetical protein
MHLEKGIQDSEKDSGFGIQDSEKDSGFSIPDTGSPKCKTKIPTRMDLGAGLDRKC